MNCLFQISRAFVLLMHGWIPMNLHRSCFCLFVVFTVLCLWFLAMAMMQTIFAIRLNRHGGGGGGGRGIVPLCHHD